MTLLRFGCLAGLIGLAGLTVAEPAFARHRHHHRVKVVVDRTPRQFVFNSPNAASVTVGAGYFAGEFQPGILGATTADPYERPGVGYYAGGGYGPGYRYENQ